MQLSKVPRQSPVPQASPLKSPACSVTDWVANSNVSSPPRKTENGQTIDRKQVEYRYDPQGIRFIATDYVYNSQTSTSPLQLPPNILIDHANFTGYHKPSSRPPKTPQVKPRNASVTPTPRRNHPNHNRHRSKLTAYYSKLNAYLRPRRPRLNSRPLRIRRSHRASLHLLRLRRTPRSAQFLGSNLTSQPHPSRLPLQRQSLDPTTASTTSEPAGTQQATEGSRGSIRLP